MTKIGLLGLGNVGAGVVRLLERNHDIVAKRLGSEVFVKRILVRDLSKPRDPSLIDKITDRVDDILGDEDISIVVELMGGEEPAHSYIRRAIAQGKHVVTANKQIIAEHGAELMQEARAAGVSLLFEASVGGGIPVIRPIQESLAANELTAVMGILNGTTNYILTRMDEGNLEFGQALKQAQALGYAESDPTDDLNGTDAARKIAILASISFDVKVTPGEIDTSGLDDVDLTVIKRGRELGYRVKLVAYAARRSDHVEACVSPAMLPIEHPLAQVKDAFNAVIADGVPVGRVMFFGKGAGGDPTASAVVGDIMHVAGRGRELSGGRYGQQPCRVLSPQGLSLIEGLPVWR